jgi:hypothetical protein
MQFEETVGLGVGPELDHGMVVGPWLIRPSPGHAGAGHEMTGEGFRLAPDHIGLGRP